MIYTYDNTIEQAFLWSIIFDNDILNETILTEEDFENEKNKLIFRMFKALKDNKLDITPLIFKSFIEKHNLVQKIWYWYFAEIDESSENSTFWRSYQNTIKENSDKNKLNNIKSSINKDNIGDVISSLSNLNTKKEDNSINSVIKKHWEFLQNFKNQWWLWYPWPYPCLDKYIWWIIPWKVFTIVAYSWVWKSNFSYSYVTDALKKWKKVVFFSLEVQKEVLFNNLLKSYYNINQTQIISWSYNFEEDHFKNLIIYDDKYKLDEIKGISKTEKADIIFIDFIQNIQTKWEWEYEKMTKIAQELQQLSIETNTTIFNISQANNESRFKWWDKIQPKWSWAIFASSDIILALNRTDNPKELSLNLLKNKYGASDKNFLVITEFRNLQFKVTIAIDEE